MEFLSRDRCRLDCEHGGISWARARLPDMVPEAQVHFREWIDEYERKEAAVREEAQRVLGEKSLAAAQLAAQTSSAAAAASRDSARWTMWAAIAAAVSAVISLAQMFK